MEDISNSEIGAEKAKLESYIKRREEWIKNCQEASSYAISRFDILIISLSTGALGFSIGFIKDFVKSDTIVVSFLLVKLSWIFFTSSIISNLLSQQTSYYSNQIEIKFTRLQIRKKRGKIVNTDNESTYKCQTKILDNFTIIFNFISLSLLITGLILTLIFICKNS